MPVATKRPLPSFSRSTPNLPTLQSQRDVVEQDITPRATARQTYNVPSPTTIQEDEDGEDIEEDDDDDDDDDFPSHYSLDARSSSDASDDDDDNDDVSDDGQQDARQGPFMHRSNSSFLNVFAPPFYNRPPTPRLTTPSLTSLLRPSFSAAPSRPTTPDSSENDTPNDTEAAVAKSARTAPTVPRASPKVPTYEYYGFVLYLVSSLCFLMYLLWSYLPSPFLHQLGIYYYPNRWWSLAIPAFLVMTIVYIYVALAYYNTEYLTLPMSSIENIVDDAANIAVIGADGKIMRKRRGESQNIVQFGGGHKNDRDWKALWSEGTDAVMDVPIGGVCEILYGEQLD